MADNNNEQKDQIIGLAELMVETLQATIDADRNTADEYYSILESYAFKPKEDENALSELEMVDFKIVDSNGQAQIISMPKLILMPVPMLHVSEANFELEGNICLTSNTKTETDTGTQKAEAVTLSSAALSKLERSREGRQQLLARNNANARLRLSLPSVKKTSESEENSETTTNMKISIKLTQSDMPSGLSSLLQVITNNIQVKKE